MTIAELKRLIDAIYENAPDAEVEATVKRTLLTGKEKSKLAKIIGVQYRDILGKDARIIVEVM